MGVGESHVQRSEYPYMPGVRYFNLGDLGVVQRHPLFVPDRDLVIDDAWVRYTVANGVAVLGILRATADGVAMDGLGTALTGTIDFNQTADTRYDWTLAALSGLNAAASGQDAVKVSSGQLVFLDFDGAPAAALGVVSIGIRMRELAAQ